MADPPGCLLGTLEAHLGARDPLEGGGPLRGVGLRQNLGSASIILLISGIRRPSLWEYIALTIAHVGPAPQPPVEA